MNSRGRTQYRYHQLWREQRDAQKFVHMLRFASVLPVLRAATLHDLKRRSLDRDHAAAGAVRLIDLGLFRIGGEKYAELDHHYGATTLEKRQRRRLLRRTPERSERGERVALPGRANGPGCAKCVR